jgi:hypothetical protein
VNLGRGESRLPEVLEMLALFSRDEVGCKQLSRTRLARRWLTSQWDSASWSSSVQKNLSATGRKKKLR